MPQTTDFGNAVQPQQLAQLARGLVLQLLDGLDAAQRHVGQQDNHVQRAVIAAQLGQAIVDVSKQAILRQSRQGSSTPPKETSRQVSKRVGAPFRKPNAARTRSSGRVHAVPISAAASATARVDLSVAVGGCGAGAFSGAGSRRPAWTGLGQSSLLDRLAERVELEAQLLGDFSWAPTRPQQLLRLGRDLRRQHRSSACRTRRVERFHAAGAILVDAANDAVLRHAEGPHDIYLAASALADQLGGKHPKRAAVVLGVLKHRLNAAEVCPLAIFAHDTD